MKNKSSVICQKYYKLYRNLEKNKFSTKDLIKRTTGGNTILTLAIQAKLSIPVIDNLLTKDKNNILVNYDAHACSSITEKTIPISPLELAFDRGNPELVYLLLKNKADFNQPLTCNNSLSQLLNNGNYNTRWDKVKHLLANLDADSNLDPYLVHNPPIENLVIEGGGAKGVAYTGAIKALEKFNVIPGIKRVGGASTGSIVALLVALGYNSKQLEILLANTNFKDFMQPTKKGYMGTILNYCLNLASYLINSAYHLKHIVPGFLTESKGTYSTSAMQKWFDERVNEILKKPNATFQDLHDAKQNNPNLKDLYIEVCNLTTGKGEVWSYENHPNTVISKAITISSSYPLVFESTKIKNDKTAYNFADGGIYDNAPAISMFNSKKYLPRGYNFDNKGANPGTYILKVDSKKECENLLWKRGKGYTGKYTNKAYLANIFSAYGNKEQILAEMYPTKIVQIPDHDISTLKFNLSNQEKKTLSTAGFDACNNHLSLYRGHGTYYFMYDPKNKMNQDELNLINHPELKSYATQEELKQERNDIYLNLKDIRKNPNIFINGTSSISLKKSLRRRLKYINMRIENNERLKENNENINMEKNTQKKRKLSA